MTVIRFLKGVFDTLRLLNPRVRAVRRWTQGRERLIDESCVRAIGGADWMALGGPAYGAGFDERVVEYPWLFEHLGTGDLVLDVGSTLNHATTIALVLGGHPRLVFLNPYRDDGQRSSADGVRYVRSDVRAAAVRCGLSLITCVSVLEHVGCDNTGYGASGRQGGADAGAARAEAMRAMRALLRPGGRLLLTVPFGHFEDHGWFQQLDAAAFDAAVAAFAPSDARLTFFLRDGGWRRAAADDCREARYNKPGPAAGALACAELVA